MEVHLHGLPFLSKMGLASAENRANIASLGGISVVLAIMEAHSNVKGIGEWGNYMLSTFADSSLDAQVKLVPMEPGLKEMRGDPNDLLLQLRRVTAFTQLSPVPGDHGELAPSVAIGLMIAAMRAYSHSIDILRFSTETLSNPAAAVNTYAEIAPLDGIDVVLEAMRAHARVAEIQCEGSKALLSSIHADPQKRAKMASTGSIEVTLAAMRAHPMAEEAQHWGIRFLHDLSTDP